MELTVYTGVSLFIDKVISKYYSVPRKKAKLSTEKECSTKDAQQRK